MDVRVIAAAGASAVTSHDRFAYAAASAIPSVTGITPASGPAAGGTTVTISGSGFTGATAVDFGTTASTFTVQSDGTIAATAPPGSGTVDVTVQGPGGTSATQPADQFTYAPFGAPVQLAFISQPAWVASLVSFAAGSPTSVSVAVYDQAGKLVGDAGGTVTLTLRGPGLLGSPWSASAQAVDGVAAFTDLEFPLTQALPGDGYTLVASYGGQGDVADATSTPFSILFPWPLVTSDPAQVAPDGTTLAVWDDVLPAPGQGDDGSIALPWRFAGVQFTAALEPASHLWLAGNAGGTSPICLDGNWTLQLSGPASQTLSGSGCTPPIDLDALGLPAGTYGGQLTLQAPASGTQYGASDVFLLAVSAAAMAPEPLPRAMQPLKLVSQSPAIPVGSTGQVPVVVRQAPVPFTYIHFGYSYDTGGLDVTGLTAPAGWSGNGCPYSSPGQGCYTSSGTPALTLGSTAFTADVTCLAPGTWDLTVASSSALGTVHYLNSLIHGLGGVNGPDMAVSAVVSVTCVAPPPGPAQASGASVNPADGTLSVTVTGSNLGGAVTATLLDGGGDVVATTADFPVKQGTVLTARSFR